MKKSIECENMVDIRQSIDKIVELISLRSDFVHEAAKFKKSETAVKDLNRVQKVINSKKELAIKYGASPELIGHLYTMMINFFVSEEMKEWKSL